MKNSLKNAGIAAITVAALAYPAYKLFKYVAKKRKDPMDSGEDHLSHIFQKKAKAHNRHALSNGHVANGHADHQHS